jgi:S-DNA-T family DNA segregation ATPase FtsK/SpoIIIE
MSEPRVIRNDIIAITLLALIVFLVAALATYDPADPVATNGGLLNSIYQPDQVVYPENLEFNNACGKLGAWTANMLNNVLGIGVYFLVIGMVALEISLFRRGSLANPWLKTIGWAVSLVCLCSLATMLIPANSIGPLIGPGGFLGALGSGLVGSQLGSVGTLVVFAALAMTGMMMWSEYLVFRAGRLAFAPALVAATAVLPFGILHRFVSWFNGTDSHLESDLEDEFEDEEYEEEEDESPRTIRFRRRNSEAELEVGSEDEDEYEEDEEEYEEDEEEYEDEEDSEFEDVGAPAAAINIANNTKTPVPALAPAKKAPAAKSSGGKKSIIPKPHFRVKAPAKKTPPPVKFVPPKPPSERELVMSQLDAASQVDSLADYSLPPMSLLERAKPVPFELQKRESLQKAAILEQTCKQFGYNVKVVEIETGPVISQYEIDLEPGLRLQKIVSLADDLAIAMRVPSVRIVAPIPGKNSVGVEVPNKTRETVTMRGVMEQCESQIKKMKVPLFLGADAVGAPLVADLAKLPHLLIAGRTGTGKSVCLNAIICSILMTRRPDEVRMLMIDPKMVEMSGYGGLPHLMHPVVTDMRKAEAILAWAVEKMEQRYRLLAKAGVRHVTSYNELDRETLIDRIKPETPEEEKAIPETLPFIVIVADEIADMMMTSGKEVEQHIIRLAQKSRAVGIHLILATQKPTVDVITGLIKSNLPARISFQVASKTDSRVVLDAMGADKLLGCGDMLFLWPGTSNLLRGQGTYLSDKEIDDITGSASTGESNFVEELINIKVKKPDEEGGKGSKKSGGSDSRDELYNDAVEIVAREQRGSLSLLQRALGIGYGRAARLVDYMAEDGYVGPYNGSKSREVLITSEMWQNILAGNGNPVNDEDWVDEATEDSVEEPGEEDVVPTPLASIEKLTSRVTHMAQSTSVLTEAPADEEVEDEYEEEEEEEEEEEGYEEDDEEYLESLAADADAEHEDEYEYEYEDEEEEGEYEDDEEEYEDDGEEYEDEEYDEEDYEDVE